MNNTNLTFITSSHCESNSCVEVAYKTSTRSGTNGACVEVGQCTCDDVHVRDSKDKAGPVLTFTPREWEAFVAGAKDGEFDLR